jgi:hypothetical protein
MRFGSYSISWALPIPSQPMWQIVVDMIVIGGHAVGRGDGPRFADMIIRAAVAHDGHRLHRKQHRESLPPLSQIEHTHDADREPTET